MPASSAGHFIIEVGVLEVVKRLIRVPVLSFQFFLVDSRFFSSSLSILSTSSYSARNRSNNFLHLTGSGNFIRQFQTPILNLFVSVYVHVSPSGPASLIET